MKVKKLFQKLKAKDHRYSVVNNEYNQSFTIYYSLAHVDLWDRDKFPLFYVSWDDYHKTWEIRMDLCFDQKYGDLILYPLKLLKKLDKQKPKEKK